MKKFEAVPDDVTLRHLVGTVDLFDEPSAAAGQVVSRPVVFRRTDLDRGVVEEIEFPDGITRDEMWVLRAGFGGR